jgi:hypothetical protein
MQNSCGSNTSIIHNNAVIDGTKNEAPRLEIHRQSRMKSVLQSGAVHNIHQTTKPLAGKEYWSKGLARTGAITFFVQRQLAGRPLYDLFIGQIQ